MQMTKTNGTAKLTRVPEGFLRTAVFRRRFAGVLRLVVLFLVGIASIVLSDLTFLKFHPKVR